MQFMTLSYAQIKSTTFSISKVHFLVFQLPLLKNQSFPLFRWDSQVKQRNTLVCWLTLHIYSSTREKKRRTDRSEIKIVSLCQFFRIPSFSGAHKLHLAHQTHEQYIWYLTAQDPSLNDIPWLCRFYNNVAQWDLFCSPLSPVLFIYSYLIYGHCCWI